VTPPPHDDLRWAARLVRRFLRHHDGGYPDCDGSESCYDLDAEAEEFLRSFRQQLRAPLPSKRSRPGGPAGGAWG